MEAVFLSGQNKGLMTALCGGELCAGMSELRKMFQVPSGDGINQSRQHAAAALLNS